MIVPLGVSLALRTRGELALRRLSDAAAELLGLVVQEQPYRVFERLSRVERARRGLCGPEELKDRARVLVVEDP